MSTDLTTPGDGQRQRVTTLQIMLDPALFQQVQLVADYMSKAAGYTPPHLLGKREACFAVVCQSNDWNLSPMAVARSTYQTPGGSVGYEGKLVHAILEASGRLVGGISYTHIGEWSKLAGKFEIRKSQKGNDYTAITWTRADAKGLGVVVSAQLRGESQPREFTFWLDQCFPLNSTLWATDPATQICYTAVRRFASLVMPHVVMGVPFVGDEEAPAALGPELARDVTPTAEQRRQSMRWADADAVPVGMVEVVDVYGEPIQLPPGELEEWIDLMLREPVDDRALDTWVASNEAVPQVKEAVEELRARDKVKPAKAKAEAKQPAQSEAPLEPVGNGARTFAMYGPDGREAGIYDSRPAWLEGLELAARAMEGDEQKRKLVDANWDLLTRIRTHPAVTPETKARAEALAALSWEERSP